MAKHPAAFINVIAEDGTKEEAIKYLQETWDELVDIKDALRIYGGHVPGCEVWPRTALGPCTCGFRAAWVAAKLGDK